MDSLNYFDVFAGADKEMMHSAMLRHLLLMHPALAQRLFPDFSHPADGVALEKPYLKGKFRIDIEAWKSDALNGTRLLVVENKFKAFPTLRQLQDYDDIYLDMGKKTVCYLVCFDDSGIAFQKNGIVRPRHFEWRILTYRTIRQNIEMYLDEIPADKEEQRIFLSHYADYLGRYYEKYEKVLANYGNAFPHNEEIGQPEAEARETRSKAKEEAEEAKEEAVRKAEQESRFWQRLVLSYVCNAFAALRPQGADDEYDTNYGGATTPPLTIHPGNWRLPDVFSGAGGKKSPVLCLQMQGDSLKLGFNLLPPKNDAGREKIFSYAQALLGVIVSSGADGIPTAHEVVRRRLDGGNRFITLFRREVEKNVPITGLTRQLWEFFQAMDAAVTQVKNR